MIRRPPRSTQGVSSAASDVYKRQLEEEPPVPVNLKATQAILECAAQVLIGRYGAALGRCCGGWRGLGRQKVSTLLSDKRELIHSSPASFSSSSHCEYFQLKNHPCKLYCHLFAHRIVLDDILDRVRPNGQHSLLPTIAGHLRTCLLYTSPSPRDS